MDLSVQSNVLHLLRVAPIGSLQKPNCENHSNARFFNYLTDLAGFDNLKVFYKTD
jgi:hypothetical protein